MNQDNTFDRVLMIILGLVMAAGVMSTYCVPKAEAAEFFLLRKAAIEGGRYYGTNHDFFLELDNANGERLQHTTDLIMNADIICLEYDQICMFWDNKIASKASNQQYRYVAWDFRLGFALGRHIELGWKHLSGHELDRKTNPFSRYVLENIVFIQFKWHDKPRGYRGY